MNLSKPKRQNLLHHADLRSNAVKFRGVRGEGRVEALAVTCMLVEPDSLPSWQMGANRLGCKGRDGSCTELTQ